MVATAEFGVKQVADQLHDQLRRYLEATYHIRDSGIIAERRSLLQEAGAIGQRPYLETTPTYALGEPYADLGLPAPVGETLAELAGFQPGIGIFPRPYAHQAEALRAFFLDQADLVVATGTGSGKTETFLFPILGHLLQEAAGRPESFGRPGCRALLLYPMNALVSDQVSRLRRLFGDERLRDLFRKRYGSFPRFGMYTSRTPYPGSRTGKKDSLHLGEILAYYLGIERDNPGLKKELRNRGRWPEKDLAGFFGEKGGRWAARLRTQPGDRELLTRHEMQARCPHILVTNYSMLEYMLLRPIERGIFRQTRQWLAQDPRNSLILVLDEAHMYRGAGGAEVALLIRRLQARLDIPRERLRCILTSASLGSGEKAERAAKAFAVGLTGHPGATPMPFRLIRGKREERPPALAGTPDEAASLAAFDLPAFFRRAEDLVGAARAIADLAAALRWPAPPSVPASAPEDAILAAERELGYYLYDRLHGFGPIELLIATTAGNATEFADLARTLFPAVAVEQAERATSALLALGTYARHGDRPLLPTRAHLFFRGLPSLHACINPRCDRRRIRPGEDFALGRLYTEPRTRCDCAARARVYELYTHRECGAAFLRVFGRGPQANFYWHERGGDVERDGEPLDECFLLLEAPHPAAVAQVEPIWLDLATGRVETVPPADQTRYRLLYRPVLGGIDAREQTGRRGRGRGRQGDEPQDRGRFSICPVCTKRAGDKIMDLATKGEQPFANLVREQFALQPATREYSERYPNGGRKDLIFSDGRQKAARLARDLPREVELDSFRQALVLAAQRLGTLGKEAVLNERLYAAFVAVCSEFHLHFFDREGGSQKQLLDDIGRFRELYDGDLEVALDDDWRPLPPVRYKQALLRQLADPFFSLHATGAAVVRPSRTASRQLSGQLTGLPETLLRNQLPAVAAGWVQALLERTAFDPAIAEEARRAINEFFRPVASASPIARIENLLRDPAKLNDQQVQLIREKLYLVLTQAGADGNPYLNPSALVLRLALDDTWLQCAACGLVQLEGVVGRCARCASDRLELRPPDHPYMTSSAGYFREPLRAVLRGTRPLHITAEEHTAQLSQRDVGIVYATTEEYELRFQDVPLGRDKPPVDVLSCTTTMEVGIDIGSLTSVGLRNVPPQRENYQQRSGRAGRRGSAVSTVLTYAQGGPHDNYYYHKPEEIISGAPREPRVKVDNRRLARRHVHSFLIQTFFHAQIDRLPREEQETIEATRTTLMSALGYAVDFFAGSGEFSLPTFRAWVRDNLADPTTDLATLIALWLPDEICSTRADSAGSCQAEKRSLATEVTLQFVAQLERLAPRFRGLTSPTEGDESEGTDQAREASADIAAPDASLLDVLFDNSLLPSYAFPTDLCAFYIFERDDQRVRIKERPAQGKDKALSEYAPGRLLVVNKETYRVGGIYVEGTNSATPVASLFAQPLRPYVYCPQCTYVREEKRLDENECCPVCGAGLLEREVLDPPGFSPERGASLNERDRDQEFSHASVAQFPTPVEVDRFDWKIGGGRHLRHAYEQDRRLVIVNKGTNDEGFRVCESCGAAWPESQAIMSGPHYRPFQIPWHVLQRDNLTFRCNGPLHPQPLYLAHTFQTDLLLLRIGLGSPLAYDARDPWLHDGLRTLAEAFALAASRRLDIDAGELSAGYRLMPPVHGEDPHAVALVDVYLFDTASGGAGYAAEVGDLLADVLRETEGLLRDCPAECERSCTKCLRHYGNRYWHERLDRHLAAQLLAYARDGVSPRPADLAEQGRQLGPLRRYLELEGWISSTGGALAGISIPLLVSKADSRAAQARRYIAVGTVPALLDTNADTFSHPLHALDSMDEVSVVLLNDYVVARDLPTAYQHLRRAVGL